MSPNTATAPKRVRRGHSPDTVTLPTAVKRAKRTLDLDDSNSSSSDSDSDDSDCTEMSIDYRTVILVQNEDEEYVRMQRRKIIKLVEELGMYMCMTTYVYVHI